MRVVLFPLLSTDFPLANRLFSHHLHSFTRAFHRFHAAQCVDLVYDELQRIVSQIDTSELARFATLRQHVVEVTGRLLHSHVEPTKQMIR